MRFMRLVALVGAGASAVLYCDSTKTRRERTRSLSDSVVSAVLATAPLDQMFHSADPRKVQDTKTTWNAKTRDRCSSFKGYQLNFKRDNRSRLVGSVQAVQKREKPMVECWPAPEAEFTWRQ